MPLEIYKRLRDFLGLGLRRAVVCQESRCDVLRSVLDAAKEAARSDLYERAQRDREAGMINVRSYLSSGNAPPEEDVNGHHYYRGANYLVVLLGTNREFVNLTLTPPNADAIFVAGREFGTYVYCYLERDGGLRFTYSYIATGEMPSSIELYQKTITGHINSELLQPGEIRNLKYAGGKPASEVCGLRAYIHTHSHYTGGFDRGSNGLSGRDREYGDIIRAPVFAISINGTLIQ